MRSQFLAVLAVSSLALVGCSSSDALAEQSPTQAISSATSTASATEAAEKTDNADAEDAFIEGLSTVTDKASQLPKNLQAKAKESYLLKRGKEYCETIAEKGTAEPKQTVDNADDLAIEARILNSARTYLCPAE